MSDAAFPDVRVLAVGLSEEQISLLLHGACAPSRNIVWQQVATLSEALTVAVDWGPDVVLLDLVLPNGTGLVTITRLKEARRKATVVVVTDLQDEPIEAYFQAGADEFIEKGSSPRQASAIFYRACLAGATTRRKSNTWQQLGSQASRLDNLTAKLCLSTAMPHPFEVGDW